MNRYFALLFIGVMSLACGGSPNPNAGPPYTGPAGTLSLVAGQIGVQGRTDGIGAAASFGSQYGLAADNTGNVYVADAGSFSIRKVVLATGQVTTIAGGKSGSSDGIGTAAQFSAPNGLAVDNMGNLYVADSMNCTIRKIVLATGQVSTIAGMTGFSFSNDGVGTAASFDGPYDVALDGTGNLFVVEPSSQTIRKVVLATAAVTTIAGSRGMRGQTDGVGSAARFFNPIGIAADGIGNLYVADSFGLRKILLSTGAVATVQIVGTPSLTTPARLTFDSGGSLYIAGFSAVQRYQPASGQLSNRVAGVVAGQMGQPTVVLGPLPGGLNLPSGIAVLSSGDIIILDSLAVLRATFT